MTHLLFVCSRNQWRSPTAESVFRRHPGVEVRSAGTSENARRTVRARDLEWADLVLVMEQKHRRILRQRFGRTLVDESVHVLEIPDDYRYMDPELVELLHACVTPFLNG